MNSVTSVRVAAPAKVNLFLRILAKEESGYHQLETLYSAVDLCDEILLHRTERGVSVEVVGPSVGPDEENLAYRAADALIEAAGFTTGVHVHLTKNIPIGAGLGGGSSDAGATLRALNTLLGEPCSASALLRIAGRLGADVPFFASGAGTALAWGRGERLVPIPGAPRLSVLLALPSLQIVTGEAYESLSVPESITPAIPGPRRAVPAGDPGGAGCKRLRNQRVRAPPGAWKAQRSSAGVGGARGPAFGKRGGTVRPLQRSGGGGSGPRVSVHLVDRRALRGHRDVGVPTRAHIRLGESLEGF